MTVFILGAGFSLAANAHHSPSNGECAKPYPLASDLGPQCFGPLWDPSSDVEAAFQAAVQAGDRTPPGSPAFEPSKVSVLHLHGSVLLYPEEFSLEQHGPG